MSALAQIRLEHIVKLEYDNSYLLGQNDCLWGNPANVGNTAYQRGYSDANAMIEARAALAEAMEMPEECF